MRVRKHMLLLLCLLLLLTTTGCWSRSELNKLAIVLAMGIDKAGEQLRVSIQVVEPEQVSSQKGAGGARAPVSTYSVVAPTVNEALRKITVDVPRKPFLAHLRILVIGEELARDGINAFIDAMSRHHEFRTDFYIVVAKDGSAMDILSISTELEKLPANTLFDALQHSEAEWAPTKGVTLDMLINNMTMPGKEPVITGIKLIGDVEEGGTRENVDNIVSEAYLHYEDLAVFKHDKLIGWFDMGESKGYNYITGNLQRTAGHSTCPSGNGIIANEIERITTKVKASIQDGQPRIYINLSGDVKVAEVVCKINLNDPKTIAKLEERLNEDLEKIVHSTIATAQKKFNTDVFGFGQAVNRADKKAWSKMEQQWEDGLFENLSVTIKTDLKIRNLGTLNNSFINMSVDERKEKK